YCYEDISSIISTEKTFDFVLNGFTIFIVGLIASLGTSLPSSYSSNTSPTAPLTNSS
ncbi:Hypothetical protein FKW44_015156, partial [Caligus rogercresseyi]